MSLGAVSNEEDIVRRKVAPLARHVGCDRIRIPPTNDRERPMIAQNVGKGVVLIEPDIPPAKRFLYFLWAMVGEFFRALDRVSDHWRRRREIHLRD